MKKLRHKLIIQMPLIIMLSVLVLSRPYKVFAAAATFVVNTEADGSDASPGDGVCETVNPGECTFRAAIEEANANGNPGELDRINFNIPGAGTHVLTPTGALPYITQPINIDGSSQGSINCSTHSLLIELNGTNFPSGSRNMYFRAGSAGSVVHGISSTGSRALSGVAGAGIKLADDNITLTCNNIGVKADGVTADPNELGIVDVASHITIGGPNAADGNLIANMHKFGTHIQFDTLLHTDKPTDILFQHNTYLGNEDTGLKISDAIDMRILDNTFTQNSSAGLSIDNTTGVVIENNNIRDNGNDGLEGSILDDVVIRGNSISNNNRGAAFTALSNTVIAGNYIGVGFDGTTSMPNAIGLFFDGSGYSNTLIGGTTESDRNIITGSPLVNVLLVNATGEISFKGNYIGLDANALLSAGGNNSGTGIMVYGAASNIMIGGIESGAGNLIAGNAGGIKMIGVGEAAPFDISVLGNRIYGNDLITSGLLGIDLMEDVNGDFSPDSQVGVTVNDSGDQDTGANVYMNYPEISNIQTSGDTVTITYSLDVNPAEDSATGYRVEFFASDAANASGHGEGQYFIGSDTVSGNVANKTISLPNTGLANKQYYFSATTTAINNSTNGFGSTSEFSGLTPATITSVQSDASGPGLVQTGASSLTGSLLGVVLITLPLVLIRKPRHASPSQ